MNCCNEWGDSANACTHARKRLANIASVAGYAAVVMLGIGLVLLIVVGAA